MIDHGHLFRLKLHWIHVPRSDSNPIGQGCPLPLEALDSTLDVKIPPLIKGYLRLGAYIGGEPAWDPDFNTADLFILLPMSRLNEKYAKHFIRK